MEHSDDLSRLVGQRITAKRAALDLTLDELARRTSVSRAMISRIERGEAHASAVVLYKLSSGLGMSLAELFAQDRSAPSPLSRRGDQPTWQDPASGYVRRDVSPPGTGSPIKIVEVEFPAGAEVAFDHLARNGFDHHVWLLDGQMEVEHEGEIHRLLPGDCLHMRLERHNIYRNPGRTPARYAVILTSEVT